jgi:hypothetical protein
MTGTVVLLLATALSAAAEPRLLYTKSFPGSVPAFVSITIEKNGDGQYKDSPEDDNPLKFKLSEAEVAEVFGLAEKLDYFKNPLESPLKVAFMGMKTFRWEAGEQKSETKFNFSEDPNARLLADWFEKISESEQHYINVERAAKYDKLGVLKAILQFETSLDRKRIVNPAQFLPLLDRVAKNESYMHTARARAANLADLIRAAK